MKRVLCDHCGKDITNTAVNTLSVENCFYDFDKKKCIGVGCDLCDDCWKKRENAHINLDRIFLHLEVES